MNDPYRPLFSSLREAHPRPELYQDIIASITRARRNKARWHFSVYTFMALLSIITFIPTTNYIGQEMQQSGFMQYLSLLATDGSAILSLWQEFIVTLIESLPVMGIAIMFVSLFTLIGSIRLAWDDFMKAFTHHSTH